MTRVKRTWSEFWKDPVFGRTWYVDHKPTRAEVYVYPGVPEWFLQLVSSHEQDHLDGRPSCTRMWCISYEAQDSWVKEKVLAPIPLLAHRLATGCWYCENCKH